MRFERTPSDSVVKSGNVYPEVGETEIRIDGPLDGDIRNITINSDLPVVITGNVSTMSILAPRSPFRFEGDIVVVRLTAKSVEGGGDLYPVMGMTVSGDVKINGELKGESFFPIEIGGDLTCKNMSVHNHVEVGGALMAEWWDTESLRVGGEDKPQRQYRDLYDTIRDEMAGM